MNTYIKEFIFDNTSFEFWLKTAGKAGSKWLIVTSIEQQNCPGDNPSEIDVCIIGTLMLSE